MFPSPSEDFSADSGVVIDFILVDQFLSLPVSNFYLSSICCDHSDNDRTGNHSISSHIDTPKNQKDTIVNGKT